MIAYYITGSNNVAIRTKEITSGSALTLRLQNMLTLVNTSSSLSGYSYMSDESLLQWTASIVSASVGDEYRAHITSGSDTIWNGSIQVYASESLVSNYTNQNTQYISHESENQYIIMN
jgi:hypothetical protein